LLANDVRGLAVGRCNRNLLLSSKGKVRFAFDLARTQEGAELSTESGESKPLIEALETYHFSEKVVLEDRTQAHAPIAIAGPRSIEIARSVLGEFVPPEEGEFRSASFEGSPARVARAVTAGSDGLRIDAGPDRAPALWRALVARGAQPTGRVVYDILRVEACAAEPNVDVDDNVYPQEARMERAFSLDKGCYIGQEVVAKIDTYGGLNKRLVSLKVSHDEPIERGVRLWREDAGEWRDLGMITSWAYSFVLDGGLALGYVKRRHQSVGTVFRIGEGPHTATIVASPVRANAVAVTGEVE
jgi:folate-binding protein YgfZ